MLDKITKIVAVIIMNQVLQSTNPQVGVSSGTYGVSSYRPVYGSGITTTMNKQTISSSAPTMASGIITFLLAGLCALAILMLGVRQQITDISTNPTNFFNQIKVAPEPISGFTASSPDVMIAVNGAKLEIDKNGIINSNTGNITLHDGAMKFSSNAVIDSTLSVITINKFTSMANGATIHGNTTITGNLNVMGTTAYMATSVTTIDDVNLILAKDNNANDVHIGISARYNKGEGIRYDSFFRDYTTGNWMLLSELETQPSGVITMDECTGYGNIEVGDIINHGEFVMPCMDAVAGISMSWNPITGVIGYVPSSRRFKKDIQHIQDGLKKSSGEIIDNTIPVHYRYRQNNTEAVGFIAEEVAKVFPQAVTHDKDGQAMTVDYVSYIPVLLDEIQKLRYALKKHGIPLVD